MPAANEMPAITRAIMDLSDNVPLEERKARLRFHEEVTEERTVEFINGEVVWHTPKRMAEISAIGSIN